MSNRDAEELGLSREYGLGQVYERGTVPEDHTAEIKRHYGRIRAYFKLRPQKYADLQRWLNQSHSDALYDRYLTRSVYYGLLAGLFGMLLGAGLAVFLGTTGILDGLSSPVRVPGGVAAWIGANRTVAAGVVLALVVAGVTAGAVWYMRKYYPRMVVGQRRRAINVTLPHAIVFMYALSHGGMNLYQVIKEVAEAEDSYGEVAREFDTVVNDVELFGNDLYTALRNARNLTPSDSMEQFLDDMISVLDSGGDITVFFEDESANYLEDAKAEQEQFLETLSLLAEVFVVGFVAAPLFLIVLLLVMSLLGASTLGALALIVYLVLPLGMLGFLILIDTLSEPYKQEKVEHEETEDPFTGEGWLLPLVVLRDVGSGARARLGRLGERLAARVSGKPYEPPTPSRAERIEHANLAYIRSKRRRALKAFVFRPLAAIKKRPTLSLLLTVPLAVAVVAVAALAGLADLSIGGLFDQPIRTTMWFGIAPLLVIIVPLSAFHERQRRRQASISKRFPDTLNILSSANKMGIQFIDALGLIARWSSGPIAEELRLVRNDIRWNHDIQSALRGFAARLRTPQLSRTVRLISGGLRSSGDLSRVLSVAAEDTRSRERMRRARRSELSTYTAVVVIGFLVYLLVIILLTHYYLSPIAETAAEAPSGGMDMPISLANLNTNMFLALFAHSAIIQAVGSGLLAGKLTDNSVLSGLKYSIVLVVVAVIAFGVL